MLQCAAPIASVMPNLERQLQQKTAQLAALREIGHAINAAWELKATLELITRRTADVMGMGHTVVGAAADGTTALRLACETRPDAAVLDIKMPGMDGLAVAQALAERCPLAVVMLTAYSERDLIEQAAATETVQAYLVKPIRDADLAPAIELAVGRFAEWQALRQEAANRQEALATREVVAKAKRILMQRDSLGERKAFLEIQHRARRQRRTMRRVAEEILQTIV